MNTTIGVIADTHGLLRPEVVEALKGSDVIFHAGDIGGPDVLHTLRSIAPTYAVRGNTDGGMWSQSLPDNDVVEISGFWFYLVHRIEDLTEIRALGLMFFKSWISCAKSSIE